MTHRNFYVSPGDKITAADAVEIKLIRFCGAGMAEVELKSDGDIDIEEFDPVAADVRQPVPLDEFFWQAFCAVAADTVNG